MTIYSNISSTFRLRTDSMGGAWCFKPMISQFSYDYLYYGTVIFLLLSDLGQSQWEEPGVVSQ